MEATGSREREFALKLQRVRALIRARGASAAALRSRRNFAWLTAGGHNHVGVASEDGLATLLVTERDAVVLTAINEAPRIADEELAGLPIPVVELPWERPEALGDAIRARTDGPVVDDATLEADLWPMRATLCARSRPASAPWARAPRGR